MDRKQAFFFRNDQRSPYWNIPGRRNYLLLAICVFWMLCILVGVFFAINHQINAESNLTEAVVSLFVCSVFGWSLVKLVNTGIYAIVGFEEIIIDEEKLQFRRKGAYPFHKKTIQKKDIRYAGLTQSVPFSINYHPARGMQSYGYEGGGFYWFIREKNGLNSEMDYPMIKKRRP